MPLVCDNCGVYYNSTELCGISKGRKCEKVDSALKKGLEVEDLIMVERDKNPPDLRFMPQREVGETKEITIKANWRPCIRKVGERWQ